MRWQDVVLCIGMVLFPVRGSPRAVPGLPFHEVYSRDSYVSYR